MDTDTDPNDIVIDVDGLPVAVDKARYKAEPVAVIAEVRQAREGMRIGEDWEPAPDFDTLEAVAAHEMGL